MGTISFRLEMCIFYTRYPDRFSHTEKLKSGLTFGGAEFTRSVVETG
jgi:hypothetical protein